MILSQQRGMVREGEVNGICCCNVTTEIPGLRHT
jgi:hypothetical protein